MHINIIGYGYVGSSVGYISKKNNVKFSVCDVIAKDEKSADGVFTSVNDIVDNSQSVNDINYYFICVPTPSKPSGECDTTIVENVIDQIYKCHQKKTVVYIKSTIQPGTTRRINNKYPNSDTGFSVLFCPEFLREKSAHEDMFNSGFVLLGSSDGDYNQEFAEPFKHLYKHNNDINIVFKKSEACELFKYTINVFLSVKVWFFNELYQLCDKFNLPYTDLQSLFPFDKRIGFSHTDVPGHDGQFGFGGTCFPKDSRALRHVQNSVGLPDTILSEILKRNDEMRKA